jgi:hypothetical protein
LRGLKDGSLRGVKELDLSDCALSALPAEMGDLSQLERLNAANNPMLSSLPESFARLRKLRIAFFLGCGFSDVPLVLGSLPELFMLSFKSNRVARVAERALPARLGWLILTDNVLEELPASLPTGLRKLMLAGNRLRALPASAVAPLQQLELVRLADNRLEELPQELLRLPRLAWLAAAANPWTATSSELELADSDSASAVGWAEWAELGLGPGAALLGRGASGSVLQGRLGSVPVAVKVYGGAPRTSDGRPEDEVAATLAAMAATGLAGCPDSVVRTLRRVRGAPPPGGIALALELLGPEWQPLAGPPSFDSVTRDDYAPEQRFTADEAAAVARDVARALAALHARGICHGDVYGHNIHLRRRRQQSYSSQQHGQQQQQHEAPAAAKLGDFGAAFFYRPGSDDGAAIERAELRAFAVLLSELAARCEDGAVSDALALAARSCAADGASFALLLSRLETWPSLQHGS